MFFIHKKKKKFIKDYERTNSPVDCQNSLLIVNYQRLLDNHLYMYRYIDNKIEWNKTQTQPY